MSFSKKLLRMALISSLLTIFFAVGASATDLGVGTVTADALRLRAEADSDASILATAEKDDVVIVLEEVDDVWYRVDYKSIEGYMSSDFLELAVTIDADLGYGRVRTNGTTLNVRSGPSTDHEQISTLRNGSVVSLLGMDNGTKSPPMIVRVMSPAITLSLVWIVLVLEETMISPVLWARRSWTMPCSIWVVPTYGAATVLIPLTAQALPNMYTVILTTL